MKLIFWLSLLINLLIVLPALAQEFTADDGFYSAIFPDGWTQTQLGEAIQLTSPTEEVNIYLLTVEEEDAETAIHRALEYFEISVDDPVQTVDAPLANGTWRQNLYVGDPKIIVSLAQVVDGKALVITGIGDQLSIQRANAQILALINSVSFSGVEVEVADYVDTSAFTEQDVSFGEEPYIARGTLSVPTGEGPFPAVVIIHGSGPSDRDGSIPPNAPYRDIAQGLASQGIVVLRFDKRTLAYGDRLVTEGELTVDSESIDDGVFAVEFLAGLDAVDSDRIYVIGHSLGAGFAPTIAQRSENVAGIVLMAGAVRTFSELVQDQIDYIISVNPENEAAIQSSGIGQILGRYQQVKEGMSYEEAFGEQASYYQSVEEITPLETAKSLSIPILILQGERDYQVTMEDFNLWQEGIGDQDNVTMISYPTLTHLFNELGDLERLAIPADYGEKGFVAQDVIDDIAGWITSQTES